MVFSVSIDIDLPRDKVISLFDNPDNMKRWQPGLLSFERLSGTPGHPGARSRLVYQSGKRRIEMIETVTLRALPGTMNGTYETKGIRHEVRNRFESIAPNKTRWSSENEFRFDSLVMRAFGALLPGVFRKQTLTFMTLFKKFAEAQA